MLEWDPTERDAWVADAERWICDITGVLQCKIDLDDGGEVTGVHVVAGMERDPRHIVRDVEGLLKVRLDIDVYYKKIGVVQVLDNAGSAAAKAPKPVDPVAPVDDSPPGQAVPDSTVTFYPPRPDEADPGFGLPPETPVGDAESADAGPQPAPIPAILVADDLAMRVKCAGVSVMATETTSRAEVRLKLGAVEVEGCREGPNHADSDIRLLAEATLAAISELITDPVLLHLREARLQVVGGQSTVLTAVDFVEGRQSQVLFGTCGTSHNRQQAVVYAILDAMNRRLALQGLRTQTGRG